MKKYTLIIATLFLLNACKKNFNFIDWGALKHCEITTDRPIGVVGSRDELKIGNESLSLYEMKVTKNAKEGAYQSRSFLVKAIQEVLEIPGVKEIPELEIYNTATIRIKAMKNANKAFKCSELEKVELSIKLLGSAVNAEEIFPGLGIKDRCEETSEGTFVDFYVKGPEKEGGIEVSFKINDRIVLSSLILKFLRSIPFMAKIEAEKANSNPKLNRFSTLNSKNASKEFFELKVSEVLDAFKNPYPDDEIKIGIKPNCKQFLKDPQDNKFHEQTGCGNLLGNLEEPAHPSSGSHIFSFDNQAETAIVEFKPNNYLISSSSSEEGSVYVSPLIDMGTDDNLELFVRQSNRDTHDKFPIGMNPEKTLPGEKRIIALNKNMFHEETNYDINNNLYKTPQQLYSVFENKDGASPYRHTLTLVESKVPTAGENILDEQSPPVRIQKTINRTHINLTENSTKELVYIPASQGLENRVLALGPYLGKNASNSMFFEPDNSKGSYSIALPSSNSGGAFEAFQNSLFKYLITLETKNPGSQPFSISVDGIRSTYYNMLLVQPNNYNVEFDLIVKKNFFDINSPPSYPDKQIHTYSGIFGFGIEIAEDTSINKQHSKFAYLIKVTTPNSKNWEYYADNDPEFGPERVLYNSVTISPEMIIRDPCDKNYWHPHVENFLDPNPDDNATAQFPQNRPYCTMHFYEETQGSINNVNKTDGSYYFLQCYNFTTPGHYNTNVFVKRDNIYVRKGTDDVNHIGRRGWLPIIIVPQNKNVQGLRSYIYDPIVETATGARRMWDPKIFMLCPKNQEDVFISDKALDHTKFNVIFKSTANNTTLSWDKIRAMYGFEEGEIPANIFGLEPKENLTKIETYKPLDDLLVEYKSNNIVTSTPSPILGQCTQGTPGVCTNDFKLKDSANMIVAPKPDPEKSLRESEVVQNDPLTISTKINLRNPSGQAFDSASNVLQYYQTRVRSILFTAGQSIPRYNSLCRNPSTNQLGTCGESGFNECVITGQYTFKNVSYDFVQNLGQNAAQAKCSRSGDTYTCKNIVVGTTQAGTLSVPSSAFDQNANYPQNHSYCPGGAGTYYSQTPIAERYPGAVITTQVNGIYNNVEYEWMDLNANLVFFGGDSGGGSTPEPPAVTINQPPNMNLSPGESYSFDFNMSTGNDTINGVPVTYQIRYLVDGNIVETDFLQQNGLGINFETESGLFTINVSENFTLNKVLEAGVYIIEPVEFASGIPPVTFTIAVGGI